TVQHPSISAESTRGSGSGCGPGGDRWWRIRRSVAARELSGSKPLSLRPRSVTAFAPATVGNVGVGFDVLGHAVVSVGDRVTVTRIDAPTVTVRGASTVVPMEAASNTAGAGLLRLIE